MKKKKYIVLDFRKNEVKIIKTDNIYNEINEDCLFMLITKDTKINIKK